MTIKLKNCSLDTEGRVRCPEGKILGSPLKAADRWYLVMGKPSLGRSITEGFPTRAQLLKWVDANWKEVEEVIALEKKGIGWRGSLEPK